MIDKSINYLGAGANLVEHNGQMVSQDALNALNMSVGNLEPDMRYDVNGDGNISPQDALQFAKYAEQENYDDGGGFMSSFYGDSPGGLDGALAPAPLPDDPALSGSAPLPDASTPLPDAPTPLPDAPTYGGSAVSSPPPSLPPSSPPPAPRNNEGFDFGAPDNPSPTPRPDNPFLNPDPPVGINPPPNPFQPGPPVGINPPININPPVGTNPPIGINPPAPLPRPDNPFLNPFPQLPTGGQGGRTYGTAPVFGGFNPGKNFPTDEFGNPLPVPFNNGGIAGLRR